MQDSLVINYKSFEEIFLVVLDKHAPQKKKIVRANHVAYMTKTLRKAIMKRSELKTKYYKDGRHESFEKYRKQKNYCSRLYKKERIKFYNNLDTKCLKDNKMFWDTVKPFLSEKSQNYLKISLVEKDVVISKDEEIAKCFSEYFRDQMSTSLIMNDTGYGTTTA